MRRPRRERRWRRAAAQAIAAMRPLVVVELQKAVERALQRSAAGEVVPPKGNPPMLVQDRFLQALDEAVGPGVAWLRPRDPNAQALTARGKDALEFLAVVRQDPLQAPAGLAIAGPHDVAQKAEDGGGRDLADDQSRPAERRRHIAAGDLPDLADAFQLADVERVQRQQVARPIGLDMAAGGSVRPLGQQTVRRRAVLLEDRQSRAPGAQAGATQQAPDRRRGDRQSFAGELVAVPLRPAGRPRQGEGDHAALRLHAQRRRPAATRLAPLRMHAVRSVLLQPAAQPIKERPRHPMAPARFTDIAQPLGLAQDAQALNVYAVLEGHWSTPFHVSPPRETRGRIGQLALVSSLRADDRVNATTRVSEQRNRRSRVPGPWFGVRRRSQVHVVRVSANRSRDHTAHVTTWTTDEGRTKNKGRTKAQEPSTKDSPCGRQRPAAAPAMTVVGGIVPAFGVPSPLYRKRWNRRASKFSPT